MIRRPISESRLAEATPEVLRELSGDTRFLTYQTIEESQVVRALRRFLGLQSDPEGAWQHAFVSDPHLPLKRARVSVRIGTLGALIDDDRARKTRTHDFRVQQGTARSFEPTFGLN